MTTETKSTVRQNIDGVVIGILIGFDADGSPLVAYPDNPGDTGVVARSTATLNEDDLGREVALLYEGGDPGRPLVIGRLLKPAKALAPDHTCRIERDNEHVTLIADREIVLRCGKASITLTRAGKIIIRGAYISSRSSGVNKLKGGSIQLN